MVAIVLGLVGIVIGVVGALQTGSAMGLLMAVPCLALIGLGWARHAGVDGVLGAPRRSALPPAVAPTRRAVTAGRGTRGS